MIDIELLKQRCIEYQELNEVKTSFGWEDRVTFTFWSKTEKARFSIQVCTQSFFASETYSEQGTYLGGSSHRGKEPSVNWIIFPGAKTPRFNPDSETINRFVSLLDTTV